MGVGTESCFLAQAGIEPTSYRMLELKSGATKPSLALAFVMRTSACLNV